MTALTPEQEAMKADYIAARGYWMDWTEGLLRLSPDFLQRYAAYGAYPAAHGPLTPAMVELVYVALDASATHLFEPGLRLHARLALDRGARIGEVMDAIQLGAGQGLDGTLRGVAVLADEMHAAGIGLPEPPRDTASHPALDTLARLDPGYVDAMNAMLAAEPSGGGLAPEHRTLLRIALSACFTAHDPDATRRHIRDALHLGVDWRAILQVLQLTAHLGVHACAVGVPALLAAIEARPPE